MTEIVKQALSAVIDHKRSELLGLLKAHGARLAYKKGENGVSPFDLSIELGRDDLTELIISFDASGNKCRRKEVAEKMASYVLEGGVDHPFFRSLTKKIMKDSGMILSDVEFVVAAVNTLISNGVDVSSYSFEVACQKALKLNSKLTRLVVEEYARAGVRVPDVAKKIIYNVLCPAQIYGISFDFDVRHFIDFTIAEDGSNCRLLSQLTRAGDFNFSKVNKANTTAAIKRIAHELSCWDIRLNSRGVKKSLGPGKVRAVLELKNGYQLVRLLDDEALNFEGRLLGHCVGDGGYRHYINASNQDTDDNKHGIYSVRSPAGHPRATLEIAKGRISQLKGPKNGYVPPDGIEAALEAVDRLNLYVSPRDLLNIGYRTPTDWELRVFDFKSFKQEGVTYVFFPSIKVKKDLQKQDIMDYGERILSVYVGQSSGVDVKVFLKLISMGAAVHPGLLYRAAETGRWAIVLELLSMSKGSGQQFHGYNRVFQQSRTEVDFQQITDLGPIHLAEKANRMDVVRKLVEAGFSVNYCPDAWKFSALHQAVKENRLDNARDLIDLGADINSSSGSIALWVAKFGSREQINFVIEQGADFTVTDQLGRDAAGILAAKGWVRPTSSAGDSLKSAGDSLKSATE